MIEEENHYSVVRPGSDEIVLAGVVISTNIIVKTNNKEFAKDMEFYKALGNYLVEQGSYDDAIVAYEAGLMVGEDADMMNNLAVIYHNQERYSEAVAKLRKLIVPDDDNPGYHYDLAVNLVDRFRNSKEQNLNDLLEALKEYELVEQLEPGYAYANENIGVLRQVMKMS